MRRTAMAVLALSLAVCLLAAVPALADVKLPAVLSSGMVLQQNMNLPVWGWADPGEVVTVTIGDQSASTVANAAGDWKVLLGPFKAGGPVEVTVKGKNTVTLTDVLFGEVWVCSGQSNMQFNVRSANNAEQEIAEANYPQIRLFQVPNVTAETPQRDVKAQWVACSPQTIPGFTAVGYFFGRHLHKALKVPVGLIGTSWGGTPAEAWTSVPAMQIEPDLQPLFDRWANNIAAYPANLERYNKEVLPKWRADVEKAKAEGKQTPRQPTPPAGPGSQHRPGNLYNAMIAPIVPFGIQGAIWYQGESNAGRAYQYRRLMPMLISDWRNNWQEGDFTFLMVQLANYMARKDNPGDSAWAELREAQSMTTKLLPKVGQAVIIDIGDAGNIHPTNKQDVGKRLGLQAQKIAYGQDLAYSGPVYKSMSVEGNKIRLKFDCVFGGLASQDGQPLKGFSIAGEDRKFVWANARIDGDTVVVSSDQVTAPVAVRYAWADNPECNLSNSTGIPASPFRTDEWPGITINSK